MVTFCYLIKMPRHITFIIICCNCYFNKNWFVVAQSKGQLKLKPWYASCLCNIRILLIDGNLFVISFKDFIPNPWAHKLSLWQNIRSLCNYLVRESLYQKWIRFIETRQKGTNQCQTIDFGIKLILPHPAKKLPKKSR